MTEDEYWELIDSSRELVDREGISQIDALERSLVELNTEGVIAFDWKTRDLLDVSYRWDLLGAVVAREGGASDDGFAAFRMWLILQGKRTFFDTLHNPDDHVSARIGECQDMCACVGSVYRERTGKLLPFRTNPPPKDYQNLIGLEWKKSELPTLFPKCTKKGAEEWAAILRTRGDNDRPAL